MGYAFQVGKFSWFNFQLLGFDFEEIKDIADDLQ